MLIGKFLKKILIIATLVYLGFGLVLFIFQNNYIYYPSNQDFNSCPEFSSSEKLNLDGTRAYYKNISDKLIIFYHGNGGSACDRSFLKDKFESLGYSHIFVEYAGYSNDSQKPSQKLLMKDVENINTFLDKNNFKEIIIAGESLGAALALYHSSIANEDKLMLVAPFYNIKSLAHHHYPLYPVGLLLRDGYESNLWTDDIKKAEVIHGTADTIIPNQESKKLFSEINIQEKKYIEITGANHNDIYYFPETFLAIDEFLK